VARWPATLAHAAAAGTVPWQNASAAIGLIGLASAVVGGATISLPISLGLLVLNAALLAGGLWLSLRLRIDAVLFHALAEGDGSDEFDRAMVDLGWLDAGRAGRPMPYRVAGLMRLVRLLVLLVAAQLMLLIVTGWLTWR